MKRILIPTDFSDNAWNAIDYSMNMFADEECTFFLLNTFTPAVPTTRFLAPDAKRQRVEDAVQEASEKRLGMTVKKIRDRYQNNKHSYKSISSFNLLAEEIAEVVDGCEIDLIVTGTKGASGMHEVYLGSNTVNIIKRVRNAPVMAVPHNYDFASLREVAFATDFNRCFSDLELKPLVKLVKDSNASVRIVYVQEKLNALNSWQQFNFNTLRDLLKPVDYYFQTVSEVESVAHTLELFAEEMDIQLLAMLNYHHSYLEKMTREPVVKRTAFHTNIPLLVLPELELAAEGFTAAADRLSKRQF